MHVMSWRYINVCNSDVFSVVCINGGSMSVVVNVMLSLLQGL